MIFEWTQPWMLWGALALVPVLVVYRRSLVDLPRGQQRAALFMRVAVLLLLLLAAAGLVLVKPGDRHFTVVVVDRSRSVDPSATAQVDTVLAEVQRQVRTGDRVAVLPYADGVGELVAADAAWTNAWPAGGTVGTDTATALQAALTAMDPSYAAHVILMTDGWATGDDPGAAASALRRSGAALDVVSMASRLDPEVQISEVRAPSSVHVGEPFRLEVLVDANQAQEATLSLYREGILLAEEPVTLEGGSHLFTFRHVPDEGKLQAYTVRIRAEQDHLVDNNEGQVVVATTGRPRVLAVGRRPRELRPFARALEQEDIEVEVRTEDGIPNDLADLQGFDAVSLHNVPATAMTEEQMRLLRSYVRDTGGGVLLVGGDRSYGLGGYFRTTLEEIMPVHSDFEREREHPSLGMVLVLDKSGSMNGLKLDLAKEAARAALDLLDARDQIGVMAFDDQTQWLSELRSASDRTYIRDRISTLRPGGGTSMGPAMRAALAALDSTDTRLKHVILLTDGMSKPDDFFGLAQAMSAAGITVSTVGIGEGADQPLLEQIASWGEGRSYFTVDPSAVPRIFARETVTATRSALLEEPLLAVPMPGPGMLRGIDFNQAPFLLGCVLTRPKATAEVHLATERGDPLLVSWRYGLGKVVAFMSDAESRWAAEWLSWEDFGAFWAQVLRDTLRVRAPDQLQVQWARQGDALRLDVRTDEAGRPVGDTMDTVTVSVLDPAMGSTVYPLERSGPDRYRTQIPISGRGLHMLRITQSRNGETISETERGYMAGYHEEYRVRPPHTEAMQTWAQLGGGQVVPPDGVVLQTQRSGARVPHALRPLLLKVALLLFLVDLALRRIDFSSYIHRIRSPKKEPS